MTAKPPKDETARKLDAAVERLGVKFGSRRSTDPDQSEKSKKAAKRLGLTRGQIFGLGLIEDE
jgi:hypothetical protein